MDVVIVTLLRKSLTDTMQSIKNVIPNPNIIKVVGERVIGDLRNQGLMQCNSDFACFVDDDIILNKHWFEKCTQTLQVNPELIAVGGKTPIHDTIGCMIFRTKEFKNAGGFPKLDDHVLSKLGPRILFLEDAVCDHQIKRGFGPLQHNLHFLCHGFQTERRAGWYYHPRRQAMMIYSFFRSGNPDYAVGSSVWLVKLIFIIPFIFEDMLDKEKKMKRSLSKTF